MERKRIKKAAFTVAAVAALAGGTAAFAAAYWNGIQFAPTGKKQDLQANQVVFPGDESMTGDSNRETGQERNRKRTGRLQERHCWAWRSS